MKRHLTGLVGFLFYFVQMGYDVALCSSASIFHLKNPQIPNEMSIHEYVSGPPSSMVGFKPAAVQFSIFS